MFDTNVDPKFIEASMKFLSEIHQNKVAEKNQDKLQVVTYKMKEIDQLRRDFAQNNDALQEEINQLKALIAEITQNNKKIPKDNKFGH